MNKHAPMKRWAEVLSIVSGKNQKDVADESGVYPIYGSGGIIGRANGYLCEPGTTIVGRKGTINNPIYVNERFWNVDTAFGVVPGETLHPKYLYYFCRYFNFSSLDKSTTIPSLAKRDLLAIEMPVPALDEQERIVGRIEELFSELDNAVETLEKVKRQLAVYRQAVVKSVLDSYCDNIKSVKIEEICSDIKVGIVIKPTQYYVNNNGVRAFRNANVRRNYIEDNDWAVISEQGHLQNHRSEVHEGDVLIARSGVNLGMAAAVPQQYNGYNAIDVVIAVPKKDVVLPRYLAYFTNSPYGIQSVKKNQRGVAQGHLNITVYGRLPILLPSLKIQKKIIEEIDARLSSCDCIVMSVNTALQQAGAMRKGILKQAFEGKT